MDTNGFELRIIGKEDAEELSELAYPLFREVYSDVPREVVDKFLDECQSPESIREQIGSGMVYAYVIVNGERVGYISYGIENGDMYLSKLYMFKEHRGSGIGSKVFDYLENLARSRGVTRIHLETNCRNEGALRFYERHGFVRTGEVIEMRVQMVKILG